MAKSSLTTLRSSLSALDIDSKNLSVLGPKKAACYKKKNMRVQKWHL